MDNEIKQQIIQGCASSSLRKYALKTKDVKLQDILVKGKTDEISKEQAEEIEKQTTKPTEQLQAMNIEQKKYKPSRRGTTHQQRTSANTTARKPAICYNCGFDYPHRDKPCPTQGKTCSYCGKRNHFIRCCKQRLKNQRNREKVNTVQDDTSSDDSSDRSDEYVYCKTNAHAKKFETELTINGQEVLFLSDTGARMKSRWTGFIIIIYAFRLQRHCAIHNKSPNMSILCHLFMLFYLYCVETTIFVVFY